MEDVAPSVQQRVGHQQKYHCGMVHFTMEKPLVCGGIGVMLSHHHHNMEPSISPTGYGNVLPMNNTLSVHK